MRFCDFINTLYERFPCSNQGQFVLELFSAACGEPDPVQANKPDDYAFSTFLPSGLSSTDATSRKRLFGNTSRYKGLTSPIRKHVKTSANKDTFISYCEASVSVESYQTMCSDFGVSPDSGRHLVFEGIFELFLEFAKATADNVPDVFVADYVTDRLMNTSAIEAPDDKVTVEQCPLCAGDDLTVVRETPSHPHKVKFYDTLIHNLVLKNNGTAVWDGRYMDFINCTQTPLKMATTRIDIKKTPPGGEVVITANVEARHIEGKHEVILDMKDNEGRLYFPDKRAELHLEVTVGWTK